MSQVLAFLTATEPMALAIDIWVGEKFYHAEFGGFNIKSESERYRLNIPYFRGGSAGTGNLVGGHHQTPFLVIQPGGLCVCVECVSKMKSILSIIFHAIYGAGRIQLTHFSYDDYEKICILSYYHHQIRSMTHLSLFSVRWWNNGMHCMSFYIPMLAFSWVFLR